MSTHEVVSADGTTIAYHEQGEGPGLVLLHGAMQSARSAYHSDHPGARDRSRTYDG